MFGIDENWKIAGHYTRLLLAPFLILYGVLVIIMLPVILESVDTLTMWIVVPLFGILLILGVFRVLIELGVIDTNKE